MNHPTGMKYFDIYKLIKRNNTYIWKCIKAISEQDSSEYFKNKIVIKKIFDYDMNNEILFNESDLDDL